MNCQNIESGCFHDKAIHEDGIGQCLMKGCKCNSYKKND
jgi:hypothetical protein